MTRKVLLLARVGARLLERNGLKIAGGYRLAIVPTDFEGSKAHDGE